MGIVLGLLPSFLPEPLVSFFAGLVAASGALVLLYEKIRLPPLLELKKQLEKGPDAVYKILTNKQLKNKTLAHVKAIRSFIKQKDYDQLQLNIMNLVKDNDEKGRPMSLYQKDYRDKGFHLESMNLRNELWARLPLYCRSGELCQREGSCNMIYEQPLTLTLMAIIANDLERLAHSLKT